MGPLLAIVGRPNVGKSSLFNVLVGENLALIADFPGLTRDRHYGKSKIGSSQYLLVDTGGITESDINLALSAQANVIGFNVRADSKAKKLIESHDMTLKYFSIIYDLIDAVKFDLSGELEPEVKEEIIGIATVKDVFRSSKLGAIAGTIVSEGTIQKDQPIRVLRENTVIYEGELESLRRFKEDVKEVKSGTECGIGVKDYNDIKSGDQIEVYKRTEIKRSI